MFDIDKYVQDSRRRLFSLFSNMKEFDCPDGWTRMNTIAIGGFIGFGFSSSKTHLCLMCTSRGRSIIDCRNGEKIARDYEPYKGLDPSGIYCEGFDQLNGESILINGKNGGGLPVSTTNGESLYRVRLNWPQEDVIFCHKSGNPYIEELQSNCIKLKSAFIEGVGFSWCGEYFAVSDECDFDIWKRIV